MSKTLTTELLIHGYLNGYFPMPDPETEEILWYRPDPRAVIPLDKFHVSRSLARSVRNRGYEVTINKDFPAVMQACSDRKDTWINQEFLRVYQDLHFEGHAHSVEVWYEQELVGGLYGVSFMAAFFAESKFHKRRDASKVALYHLVQHMLDRDMDLLEVQFLTPHLESLGAVPIPDEDYRQLLAKALQKPTQFIDQTTS